MSLIRVSMARESGEPIVLVVGGASVKENKEICGPLKRALLDTYLMEVLNKGRSVWALLLWSGVAHGTSVSPLWSSFQKKECQKCHASVTVPDHTQVC